jgi:hypothetical protein
METAGKQVDDEDLRELMKENRWTSVNASKYIETLLNASTLFEIKAGITNANRNSID